MSVGLLTLLGLAEKALGLTDKLVSDGQAQRSTEEKNEKLEKFNGIASAPDSDERGQRIAVFVEQLCLEGGQLPAGNVQDGIRVPVSHLTTLIEIAAEKIKLDRDIAAANYALSKT